MQFRDRGRVGAAPYRVVPLLAVSVLLGCRSGNASYMRFSTDTRLLVYEDYRYPVTFVRTIANGQTQTFAGQAKCIDRDTNRIVIAAAPGAFETAIHFTLVERSGDRITTVRLPDLAVKAEWWQINVGFGDTADILVAAIAPQSEHARHFSLRTGESAWRESAGAQRIWPEYPYERDDHPTSGPYVLGAYGLVESVGVRIAENPATPLFPSELVSPDERWVCTQWPAELRDTQTGQRAGLIEKNDLLIDIAEGAIGTTIEAARFAAEAPFGLTVWLLRGAPPVTAGG
jgi:hypothetical protein